MKNSLTGYVLSQLSEFHTGLRFAGAKIVHVSPLLAEEHYSEHKGKPFYPPLVDYIMGKAHFTDEPKRQRIIAFVFQGDGAVRRIREIAGPTNPHLARVQQPGCIRSLGTVVEFKDDKGIVKSRRMDNLIHASATDEEAEREIKLWFKPNDIPPLMHGYVTKYADDHFYYKDNRLFKEHVPDSICLLAPGDVAWETDLLALQQISLGETSVYSIESVIAKYLVNNKATESY